MRDITKTVGFVLIELMIALALGLIIISGLLGVYVAAYQIDQEEMMLNNNQADADLAITLLQLAVHKADVVCAKDDHTLTVRYTQNGLVMQETYFLSKNSLFEDNENNKQQEKVRNISAMNFLFTIKDNSNYFSDVSADAVKDWSHVLGVRIQVIVGSKPYVKTWYSYAALP